MGRRVALLSLVVIFAGIGIAGTWLSQRMTEAAQGIAALEPRRFESLTVIAVGTGGAYENPLRRGPSVAVGLADQLVLIDAGRGVAEGLRAASIPVVQPRTVFLTSLLAENTVGLDDLLLTGWIAPRTQPLRVVGPEGCRDLVVGLTQAHRQAVAIQGRVLGISSKGARIDAVEVEQAWTESYGGMTVTAIPIEGAPFPSLAIRVTGDGRTVLITGSGPALESVAALARGAQLLVHEGFFAEAVRLAIESGASDPERIQREADFHTSLADLGDLAQRADVRALGLVRVRPPPLFEFQARRIVERSFDGEVWIPKDGDEFVP